MIVISEICHIFSLILHLQLAH